MKNSNFIVWFMSVLTVVYIFINKVFLDKFYKTVISRDMALNQLTNSDNASIVMQNENGLYMLFNSIETGLICITLILIVFRMYYKFSQK
jgi:hypothetical protein